MSNRHTSNDAGCNAGCGRLKALADSINDTARMARATLSLLLVVALYLGFTLLSSTDENLILNAKVVVLQVGSGIALKQSYIFGPWIFLYLHLQALFLLSILHRKMDRFNTALDHAVYGSRLTRREYWDWLSAFAFVQRLRPDRRFRFFSRFLMWSSTEAIPLVLLFIITLSFVRYQHEWITLNHKIVFALDLASVIVFNCLVAEQSPRIFFGRLGHFLKWFIKPVQFRRIAWKDVIECWNLLKRSWPIELVCWFLKIVKITLRVMLAAARIVVAIIMVLVLIKWAIPPTFDLASYEGNKEPFWEVMEKKRDRIWRSDSEKNSQSESLMTSLFGLPDKIWKFRNDVWEEKENGLDAGPCEWLGFACRYLDARNLWLITSRADYVSVSGPGGLIDTSSEETQWFHANGLSLFERNLRFADLRRTQLQGTNLESARLQGANLEGANLQDALLEQVDMHGAYLANADLQDAGLSNAKLKGANLERTRLQRVQLYRAQLQSASLIRAELQNASLFEAKLQGADMELAHLDNAFLRGANLSGAKLDKAGLRGANLNGAKLHGTILRNAKLQGANLQNAQLLGAYLEGAQLEGVDMKHTEIRHSFGTPKSWHLAWMPCIVFDDDRRDSDVCAKPSKAVNKEKQGEKEEEKVDIRLRWETSFRWMRMKDKFVGVGAHISLEDHIRHIDYLRYIMQTHWLSESSISPREGQVRNSACRCTVDSPCKIQFPPNYWCELADWTAEFACKNKYTARSSWNRWNDEAPLGWMEVLVDPDVLDEVKWMIHKKLIAKRKSPKCAGLRDISHSEWKRWRIEPLEVRPVGSAQRLCKSAGENPATRSLLRPRPTHLSPIQEIRP